MTKRRRRELDEQHQATRRALIEVGTAVLATSLHTLFCDEGTPVTDWDYAVVEHVVRDFVQLPWDEYAALLMALKDTHALSPADVPTAHAKKRRPRNAGGASSSS